MIKFVYSISKFQPKIKFFYLKNLIQMELSHLIIIIHFDHKTESHPQIALDI